MMSQFSSITSFASQFYLCCFVSFVKFSYWSKFHVNISTGSGVMAIYFYQGLTRNLEIRNTFICPLSGDWGELGIPNLTQMSNEMLLNAAKCQGYSFTVSELLRENHPD